MSGREAKTPAPDRRRAEPPLRQRAGALVLDAPRICWGLRPRALVGSAAPPWVFIRNRNDRLLVDAARSGAAVDAAESSRLHGPAVLPRLGLWLRRRCFADRPVSLRPEPPPREGAPAVSFVIGHRGRERLPLLRLVLSSIAGQEGVPVECVVVDQSPEPAPAGALPSWVRYLHAPAPDPRMPWAKAWALNIGVRAARAETVVLHDGDILAPRDYAREAGAVLARGYDGADLKRFVFCLSAEETAELAAGIALGRGRAPVSVIQNNPGMTLAVRRSSYLSLGGMDETFVGWGGEDNEFLDRLRTLPFWHYGFLPMIHLWHPPQPEKVDRDRWNTRRTVRLLAVPAGERIRALRERPFGDPRRPPEWRPARERRPRAAGSA